MSLIVQKFGGTSVADSEKILAAARKAVRAQKDGNQVLVVVSAMGKNTDMLIELAGQITDRPAAREMDMLLSTGEQVSAALMAMAIQSLGYKAVSLTGAQIGIRTDSTHRKARIVSISTERVRRLLDKGSIVIAAGFQGIDEDFNITTLGRGGSDTTAVALAAVLRADQCEIYTDVDGVYTTDPRVLPDARRVGRISYDEMLELASLGAGVMHSRSIEFAKKFSVPIHVRSSFTDAPGTMITADPELPLRPVCGAAVTNSEARVTIVGVPDVPGTAEAILSRIADRAVAVDMIVQNVSGDARTDISFTVPKGDLPATVEAVEEAVEALDAEGHTCEEDVAKVSVVGLGMALQTGVARRTFRALADAGVNIEMITTSRIKISMLVSRRRAQDALRAVHQEFRLDCPTSALAEPPPLAEPPAIRDNADVVAHLQDAGMEDLVIDDISLDPNQARVTILDVPDSPGVVAKVFEEIAAADIFVDMIVQSSGKEGRANLSFTVEPDMLEPSVAVAKKLTETFQGGAVTSAARVAKLEVSGIGLRSHTDVATHMFRALSQSGINVDIISTSEVRVTVVVDGALGEKALDCLQEVFAGALR